MFGRRNRTDDDLKSTGFVKWANKFFRFVLFPFIHPLQFVIFLLILVVITISVPLYQGIQIKGIPSWYLQLWNKYYRHTETLVDNVVAPVKEKVADIQDSVGYNVTVKTVEKKPSKEDIVAYASPKSVNRKLFEQAQEIPVDVKATIEMAKTSKNNFSDVQFKRIDGLGLSYLETPEELVGRAVILNPNEIMINGKVMFLYGIYTSPSSKKGKEAEQYLKTNIEGNEISCLIGAYTRDKEPTAICFYNGVSINQRLIDLKYAKNVGLN